MKKSAASDTGSPLRVLVSPAEDHIDPSNWMPPQRAKVPRVRIGRRFVNVLWAVPIVFLLLVAGVTVARPFYDGAWFQQFLVRYPGIPSHAEVQSGFPLWLRVLHVLNLFFMFFIIRSGIQILADHRGSTGRVIARPARTGSASHTTCPRTGSGPRRMMP